VTAHKRQCQPVTRVALWPTRCSSQRAYLLSSAPHELNKSLGMVKGWEMLALAVE
jgi:hypothetical protein